MGAASEVVAYGGECQIEHRPHEGIDEDGEAGGRKDRMLLGLGELFRLHHLSS